MNIDGCLVENCSYCWSASRKITKPERAGRTGAMARTLTISFTYEGGTEEETFTSWETEEAASVLSEDMVYADEVEVEHQGDGEFNVTKVYTVDESDLIEALGVDEDEIESHEWSYSGELTVVKRSDEETEGVITLEGDEINGDMTLASLLAGYDIGLED